MENKNLTNLTKGFLHVSSNLSVPLLPFLIYDDKTYVNEYQYKICRYVGTSCRVIGTCFNLDEARVQLQCWRDYYSDDDVFLLQISINLYKLPD